MAVAPPADVVDVVDLPGGVVQEVHGRLLHQDVVVVGGAPHERRDGGHLVTDLEAEPSVKNRWVTG